jgi:DNA-binding response OmpR family regulator
MLRVLILDDESLVLEMLAACLRAPGVQLTTCREIEAAEALLKGLSFVSKLGGLDGTSLTPSPTAGVLSGV